MTSSHSEQLKEGEDYYIDQNGLLVFTELYLRKRGYCCGNGCRHCPYDREKSPPKKTKQI